MRSTNLLIYLLTCLLTYLLLHASYVLFDIAAFGEIDEIMIVTMHLLLCRLH